MIIKNARILNGSFAFEHADVEVANGLIRRIGRNLEGLGVFDAQGLTVLPGLVDIHTHGCIGSDACDADPEGYRKMALHYAREGVTSFLFTTMTLPVPELVRILRTIASYIGQQDAGAYAYGVNLEGPFLNSRKKGAQRAQDFIAPSLALFDEFNRAAQGQIRILALAPELPGAQELIESLSREAVVSIAHTDADYEQACRAITAGATHITHMFNAMNPFLHREPGVIGAAFDLGATFELICDGNHIAPSVIRAAFRLGGSDKVVLVSDSIRAAGLASGTYSLGGQSVIVKDGRAMLADGTIAGSSTSLIQCVRNAISYGIPYEDAVKAASENPARVIGVAGTTGSIREGNYADLLIVDEELRIQAVYARGVEQELN